MKKLFVLLVWVLLFFSAKGEQRLLVEERPDSTFLRSLIKRGNLLKDFRINAQVAAAAYSVFNDYKHDKSSFLQTLAKVEFLGSINKYLSYNFKFNFNSFDKSTFKTSDQASLMLSHALITWKPFKKTSFTIGKQDRLLGGHEFNTKNVNVNMYTDFGEAIPSYAVGLSLEQILNDNHTLYIQVTNNDTQSDDKVYFNGIEGGIEDSKIPLFASVYWEGNFFDHSFTTRYSISGTELAENKKMFSIYLGNTFKTERFLTYIDILFDREELDHRGTISGLQTGEERKCTAQNVDYFAIIFDFDYWLNKKWKVFIKGDYEVSNVYKSSGTAEQKNDFKAGNYIKSWMGEVCVEFFPFTKKLDFRLYLGFTHKQYYMSELAKSIGGENYSNQYIGLGCVCNLAVF